MPRTQRGLLLLLPLTVLAIVSPSDALTVIDVRSSTIDTQTAVLACAGVDNRAGPNTYVLMSGEDATWLNIVQGLPANATAPTSGFLQRCLSTYGVLRYNLTGQQALFPSVVTAGAVLTAIPATDSLLSELFPSSGAQPRVVMDTIAEWGSGPNQRPVLNVTAEVWDRFGHNTTSLAMMDPGYDYAHPLHPVLAHSPHVGLVDFIFKAKLFTMFLVDACIPLTHDYALMSRIASENPWKRPISTYGYNSAWPIAGDLFEAETDCVKEHNLGQIASDGCSNLGFFSAKPAISKPLLQNPRPSSASKPYNASRTYINLIIGDGDNLNYLKSSRLTWFNQRLARCAKNESAAPCYPLSWSLSPQTLYTAPDWARVYYNLSYLTGRDYFVFPPSGSLYSYPAMMDSATQASFVAQTEAEATMLSMSVSVTWEWFGWWGDSIKNYLPRYSDNNIVRGFVPVNVPFMIPVLEFLNPDEFFKVLGDHSNVVLFRPREWRGTSGKSTIPFSKPFYLAVADMAAELNGYPKGTVSAIYLTSDGGANLQSFDGLVAALDEHVEIVDPQTAVEMALSSGRGR